MIEKFKGRNSFLSNFYNSEINYEGNTYPNAECAFQAAKCINLTEKEKFKKLTAAQAKKFGRKVSLRPDWESAKLGIMKEIVDKKFEDPELADKLLNTGDSFLVEGNSWGDIYWGVCNGVGKNHLGKILMETRNKIKIDRK